jgi:hypothetical protein
MVARRLLIIALVLGILVLAVSGRPVRGFRWSLTGGRLARLSTT